MTKKIKILIIDSVGGKALAQAVCMQAPDGVGNFENCFFTADPNDEPFDAVIHINKVSEDITVTCNPNNVICIATEPSFKLRWENRWIYEKNAVFAHIVGMVESPPKGDKRYYNKDAVGLCRWLLDKSYPEIQQLDVSQKPDNDKVLWITSNTLGLPAHFKRMYFYEYIKKHHADTFNIFGRGIHYIDSKYDGFAEHKYILAIENCYGQVTWSEKLTDCLLMGALPFYCGMDILEKHLPKDCYISIDITKPEQAVKIIQQAIRGKEWEKRLPAIQEARERIMKKYNIIPYMSRFIQDTFVHGEYETVTLPKYEPSRWSKIYVWIWCRLRDVYNWYWMRRIKYMRHGFRKKDIVSLVLLFVFLCVLTYFAIMPSAFG